MTVRDCCELKHDVSGEEYAGRMLRARSDGVIVVIVVCCAVMHAVSQVRCATF